MLVALAVVAAAAMLTDWAVIVRRGSAPAVEHVTRPAPIVVLAVAAVAAGALDEPAGRWLVLAILLGALGDVALVEQTPRRFLAGLTAFLLGHLSYVASFLALGLPGTGWLVVGSAAALLVLLVGPLVVRGAARQDGPVLGLAVTCYLLVIGTMVVLGSATGSGWVAVGAVVFLASDAMLGISGFVRELAWAKLPIVATYHVGQALLALGVLTTV